MERVAWVTGAGRGLGRAVVHKLRAEGLRVAACSRTPRRPGLPRSGGRAAVLAGLRRGDLTPSRPRRRDHRPVGRLDVVVNNAGIGWYKPFLDHFRPRSAPLSSSCRRTCWGRSTSPTPRCPTLIARKGHPPTSPGPVCRPLANMVPYVASKHGVLGFSASLLREVKSQGVKVTTFLPGIIDTGFGDSTPGSREESWSLRPEALADVIWTALNQPGHVVLDELAVHPLHQDF
ncbi:MAG: SDR family NAD(P)-dependent oxidoreductase [bacterium]